MAESCLLLMSEYRGEEPINVGSGQDVSIGELARVISDVVGFTGELRFDPTKPNRVHLSMNSAGLRT